MKKIIILMLFLLLLIPTACAENQEYDVDSNLTIDTFDVRFIWNNIGTNNLDPYDVNSDGTIDVFDARLTWNHIGEEVTEDEPTTFIDWIYDIIYG